MKESSTYQAILEEGRQEGLVEGRSEGAVAEAKKILRIFGDGQFGPPDAQTVATLEAIDDLARLEELASRLQAAKSWQEVLGSSTGSSRKKRQRRSP